MIKERIQLNKETYLHLCHVLCPLLEKSGTQMKLGIDVKIQITVTFSKLSTKNTLRMCGKRNELAQPTTSIIVRNCCKVIKIHLKPLVFQKLTKSQIQTIVAKFEETKSILYIIGVVDGSDVNIIIPRIDPASYYFCKGFYFALL